MSSNNSPAAAVQLDPFIGPVQLPTGIPGKITNYQVSVLTNQQLLTQLNQTYLKSADNQLLRLEPVNSVTRIVENHIGFQGYNSQETPILPVDLGDAAPSAPDGPDISNRRSLATGRFVRLSVFRGQCSRRPCARLSVIQGHSLNRFFGVS